MSHPYKDLPAHCFWRSCREDGEFLAQDLYQPKFYLEKNTPIATAGSCFAQHISRYLRASDAKFLDVEPAPEALPEEDRQALGYGLYSARFGNIYSTRQFRELIEEAQNPDDFRGAIWEKNGRFFDALRPNIEPEGYASKDELRAHRAFHLRRLQSLFSQSEVFIFTLGLTEYWEHLGMGRALPLAPGVIAGDYDPKAYAFRNAGFAEVKADLEGAFAALKNFHSKMRFLITVSPVQLAATATGAHVLKASLYSKSVLRAVAGELAMSREDVDYFPSFELMTGSPFLGQFFQDDLRTVRKEGVAFAMALFFEAQSIISHNFDPFASEIETRAPLGDKEDDPDRLICEEELLDAFS